MVGKGLTLTIPPFHGFLVYDHWKEPSGRRNNMRLKTPFPSHTRISSEYLAAIGTPNVTIPKDKL